MSHTTSHKEKQKHIEPAVEKNIHEGHEPTPEHAETRTPSWFSRDIPTSAGGSLADRYRTARPESNLIMETPGPEAYEAYRRRLDEKFTQAQRILLSAGPLCRWVIFMAVAGSMNKSSAFISGKMRHYKNQACLGRAWPDLVQ
jgi:hypothetical protein